MPAPNPALVLAPRLGPRSAPGPGLVKPGLAPGPGLDSPTVVSNALRSPARKPAHMCGRKLG